MWTNCTSPKRCCSVGSTVWGVFLFAKLCELARCTRYTLLLIGTCKRWTISWRIRVVAWRCAPPGYDLWPLSHLPDSTLVFFKVPCDFNNISKVYSFFYAFKKEKITMKCVLLDYNRCEQEKWWLLFATIIMNSCEISKCVLTSFVLFFRK